jgi:two-component system, LytTR family, sensor kinase
VQFVWKYKIDHLAFWFVTVVFYAFNRAHIIDTAGMGNYVLDVTVHNLLLAAICYTNIYFLFNRFFKKDRYLLYISTVAILLLIYTLFQNAFDMWMSSRITLNGVTRSFFFNTYYNFSIGIFYLAFTLSLDLSKRWYKQQVLLHKMETEKLSSELAYLKAQLNPHFLFNSINTIYFQIDPSNHAARESLQKFSNMLRYQLYECNEDAIPIEKEVSYLESYIDLQRLRKTDQYAISFNNHDNIRDFKIAPLLLLPFIENAFKHISSRTDMKNTIEVNLYRQNGSFTFSVLNSTEPVNERNSAHGIGLKNVQRRLDLLYADRYKLNIDRQESMYFVELELKIA